MLQEVLLAASDAAGCPSVSISRLKEMLRDRGKHALASRVGKLSKGRNVAAHPDLGLASAVAEALAADTTAIKQHEPQLFCLR